MFAGKNKKLKFKTKTHHKMESMIIIADKVMWKCYIIDRTGISALHWDYKYLLNLIARWHAICTFHLSKSKFDWDDWM